MRKWYRNSNCDLYWLAKGSFNNIIGIGVCYDVKIDSLKIAQVITYFNYGCSEEDVPEDIKKKFQEYISSEFFDIDLRRYIEKEGLVNARLYEDRGV